MPSKRAAQVVVDPIAAAAQLGKQGIEIGPGVADAAELVTGAEILSEAKKLVGEPYPLGPVCALGHGNAPEASFCATCGLAMDAPAPVKVDLAAAQPRPAGELSDSERAERDRQHTEALAAARQFENAPVTYAPPPAQGESVLIHFIEDGLTAFGQVWYRGQELEIGPGHPRWERARGWVLLGRAAQIDRWGQQYFAPGPWPGRKSYLDGADGFEKLAAGRDADGNPVTFAGPGEEALRQADEAERRRGRAVPAPLR
jgi:hypothetical protein